MVQCCPSRLELKDEVGTKVSPDDRGRVLKIVMHLKFPELFRLASIMIVVTILFYSPGYPRPDSLLFYSSFFFLVGLSALLSVAGIRDFAARGAQAFGWPTARKVSVSVVAGVVLTFLSAPRPYYPPRVGYPLPFFQTMIFPFGVSFASGSPVAFLVDCAFWVSLVSPAVWFASSTMSRRLRGVGRLEVVGVSAFLTYGSIPFVEGLVLSGVLDPALGTILPAWVLYSPAVGLALYFLPGAVVGILFAIKRYKALGLRVVLASLLLMGLLLLLDVVALILAPPLFGF